MATRESNCTEADNVYSRSRQRPHKGGIICDEYADIHRMYTFGTELGRGASGVVRRCYNSKSNCAFACKSVSKLGLRTFAEIQDMRAEVLTLQLLQKHPAVVRLHHVCEDPQNVHLVMEMCEGGDLFSRIKDVKFFSEPEAAKVCKTLASILACSHKAGIMHRDLKPENILLASKQSNTDLRLADFGSAAFFKPGQRLSQLVGSPLYIAPTVLQHSYGPEADLWSLGVILYIMLSGVPPFWGDNNADIFRQILFSPINLERGRWAYISQGARNLVSRLLSRNPAVAMTAEEVLNHPWIQKNTLLHHAAPSKLHRAKHSIHVVVNPPKECPMKPDVRQVQIRPCKSVNAREVPSGPLSSASSKQPSCKFLRGFSVHKSRSRPADCVAADGEYIPNELVVEAIVGLKPNRITEGPPQMLNFGANGKNSRLRFF